MRWQLLLVVICLGLVLSLLSYQIQTTGLCTTRIPSAGGRLGVGIVGRPDKINPLLSSANPVDQELVSLIFDGLMRYDEDGALVPAIAEEWSVSDDGKALSFNLREDVYWHDGQPVTAEDVVFTYELLQSEEFRAPENLKDLWSSVVISSSDDLMVEFALPQPYGPFLDATTLGLLPEHLLGNVPLSELTEHNFNSSPVGTGPFAVSHVINWEQTGQIRLVPDPEHWRRDIQIDTLDYFFYPDEDSLAEAFSAGAIQAVANIPGNALPQFIALPSIRLFTSPSPRISQLLFNLNESASAVVRTASGRQALSRALNRPELIDLALSGQGLPLEGPYMPLSWAYDSQAVSSIEHDPSSAAALLDELGWIMASDGSTRAKEGENLTVRLLHSNDSLDLKIAQVLAGQWGDIGVGIELTAVPQDDLIGALGEGEFDLAIVEIQPPGDPDLYDFWSQEAIVNGQNYGSWNNRRASEALESGRQLYTVDERLPFYTTFQEYFSEDLPALTLFQFVDTFALSETVQEAEVGLIEHPRERFDSLPEWFILFREVATACPEDSV